MKNYLLKCTFLMLLFASFALVQNCYAFGKKTITDKDTCYNCDDLDKKPQITYKEMPYYPEIARKSGTEGTVIVSIIIDKEGKVEKAKVKESVKGLDDAALSAAKKCKFKPGIKDGQPVKVQMDIPYKFRLS